MSKKALLLLMLLLFVPLISSENLSDNSYKLITGITSGGKEVSDTSYKVFLTVEDIFIEEMLDDNYDLCIGLSCQMFTVEDEAVTEEPSGVSGGGGDLNIYQNISVEDFNTSIKVCLELGGVPVNVKGGIFCKVNNTYIPIEKVLADKIDVFGIDVPNVGAMISKDKPLIGWMVIGFVMVTIAFFIFEQRSVVKRRRAKRRVKKLLDEKKEEKENADNKKENQNSGLNC